MNINQKIQDNIEILKNTTFIEIAPGLYKDLSTETLEILKNKNIGIEVNNKIKTVIYNPYKTDCFAYKNKKCKALRKIDCIGCKFYRNDINMEDIEKDIIKYSQKL